ncbi:MAG: CPBP family intramembrane metalloprotease [Bacteroidetes bacterium]|nr:CPBP family intramembrane metalloprotease [Bacteroidota bacterium]
MQTLSFRLNSKTVLGILLMCFLMFAGTSITNALVIHAGYSYKTSFIVSRVYFWLCLLVMALYVIKIEQTDFLIWQETKQGLLHKLLAIIILLVVLFAGMMVVNFIIIKTFHFQGESTKTNHIVALFKKTKWLMYFTAITAGIVEELLFRGYLIPRLQKFFKTAFWPIFISSALFALAHAGYGTFLQVIGPFYIGLIFAIFYNKYKNITPLIICHLTWDLLTLFVLMSKK